MSLPEKMLQSIADYINGHFEDTAAFFPPKENCRPDTRCKSIWAPCSVEGLSLEEMLQLEDAGFTETLLRLIDQSGKKDADIYKRANLSRQHFSKIRGNLHYRPTKPTAILLALALELDLDATQDLIGRAGYALTNSSKFDLIIRYFIEQEIYDVVQINMALYRFDQPLLSKVP